MTRVLTQNDFDRLLEWLDSNRAIAGEKYEVIRNGLIQMFNNKGCIYSEDLADETIDRVAGKVNDLRKYFTGEPVRYFHGVAKKVYMESLKKKRPVELMATLEILPPVDVEEEYECLERCLEQLSAGNRTMVLQYYSGNKRAKINSRRALMEILNLKASALRVRVFRIKEMLEKCVSDCLRLKSER